MSDLNLVGKGNLLSFLNKKDLFLKLILFVGAIYLTIVNPFAITMVVLTMGLNFLLGNKLKFWQKTLIIATLLMFFNLFDLPAQALFLGTLEEFVAKIVTDSNSSVSAGTITLIFNLIRGIFLILMAVASLFAYNQAQQGNDWRPIATQAGMALGVILVIDVITELFVGSAI